MVFQYPFSQTVIKSKSYGDLSVKELDHGLARVVMGKDEAQKNSPTGKHNWLDDFEIIKVSDSIQVEPKANFGIVYEVDAKDTVDIDVTIEWIKAGIEQDIYPVLILPPTTHPESVQDNPV